MSFWDREVRDLLERLEGKLSRAVLRGPRNSNVHSATRLLEKWKRACAYCGKQNIPLQVEHIIPRAKYRDDRVSNLCIACEKCNIAKGTKDIKDFLKKKPEKLAIILAQAKAPLRDAAAINSTRSELFRRLQTLEL